MIIREKPFTVELRETKYELLCNEMAFNNPDLIKTTLQETKFTKMKPHANL